MNLLEAVREVKQALGDDAWIIATRRVRRGGWFRFWARPRVEVIALEADTADASRRPFDPALLELRRLGDRVEEIEERVAEAGHLSEEIVQLRRTVEDLRARSALPSSTSPTPTRLARTRIRPDAARGAVGSDS
jgi:flagellar biosynthesis GTPase FlhF